MLITLKLLLSQIFFVVLSQAVVLDPPPKKIKIIHRGEELKPIGTVWITTGKCSPPDDRELDHIFGRCVEANQSDFDSVIKFFKNSNNITNEASEIKTSSSYYEIVIEPSHHLFLTSSNYKSFVSEWRAKLAEKKVAKTLIDLFK